MKQRLLISLVLAVLLAHGTGCMSYMHWQNERDNRKVRARYDRAVAAKMAERIPMGTWHYYGPVQKMFGFRTEVWLSLFGDGSFDRLRHDRANLFEHWKYDCGMWDNLTNMSARLTVRGQSNATEAVDLSTRTNLFVQFDMQVQEGSQPVPERYRDRAHDNVKH